MRSFFRVCGCIALFLLGAGLVLTITGFVMGKPEQMAEAVTNATGGIVQLNNQRGSFAFMVEGEDYDPYEILGLLTKDNLLSDGVGKEVLFGEGSPEKLQIKVEGCELEIRTSEDGTFFVEGEENVDYEAGLDVDKMIIRCVGLKNTDSKKKMILYMPADCSFEKAEVDLGAGVIDLEGLTAQKLEIKIGAGQLKASNIDCDECSVKVGAGDFSVKDAFVNELECEIGAGNFSYNGVIDGDAKVECSMGNVNLKIDGDEEDFNYEIDCAAGNVTLAGMPYSGLAAGKEIDNNADKDMELKCSLGNINVSFR